MRKVCSVHCDVVVSLLSLKWVLELWESTAYWCYTYHISFTLLLILDKMVLNQHPHNARSDKPVAQPWTIGLLQ